MTHLKTNKLFLFNVEVFNQRTRTAWRRITGTVGLQFDSLVSVQTKNYILYCLVKSSPVKLETSVTRLNDLLDFGQLFKAFGANSFVQISHILSHFL